MTRRFDRWTDRGWRFVFGYDARGSLVETADALPSEAWRPLVRRARHPVKTSVRVVCVFSRIHAGVRYAPRSGSLKNDTVPSGLALDGRNSPSSVGAPQPGHGHGVN